MKCQETFKCLAKEKHCIGMRACSHIFSITMYFGKNYKHFFLKFSDILTTVLSLCNDYRVIARISICYEEIGRSLQLPLLNFDYRYNENLSRYIEEFYERIFEFFS